MRVQKPRGLKTAVTHLALCEVEQQLVMFERQKDKVKKRAAAKEKSNSHTCTITQLSTYASGAVVDATSPAGFCYVLAPPNVLQSRGCCYSQALSLLQGSCFALCHSPLRSSPNNLASCASARSRWQPKPNRRQAAKKTDMAHAGSLPQNARSRNLPRCFHSSNTRLKLAL